MGKDDLEQKLLFEQKKRFDNGKEKTIIDEDTNLANVIDKEKKKMKLRQNQQQSNDNIKNGSVGGLANTV